MGTFTYKKVRRSFGRQCIFSNADVTLCEIDPDDALKKGFKRENSASFSIQSAPQMATNEVATEDANMRNQGLYHSEGGWPQELNATIDEEKDQYRQLCKESVEYITQLKAMCLKMEHKIAQNNAVNIFEEYFVGGQSSYQSNRPQIDTITVFERPFKLADFNAIHSHSSIAPTSNDKMVISYTTPSKGQMTINKQGMSSYIWDLEQNLRPILELVCPTSLSLSTVEYNVKDETAIAAGRSNGTVALYDARIGGKATMESIREESHRESVSSLQWMMSKGNVEFFTCANDAKIMTWDIRKLEKPFETYELKLNGAGCSTSDYLFTMPTRFLIGTTDGFIVNGNKREQTYEKRFPYMMKSFTGPVHTVERNPFADKYALSVGDQSIRIWSDEIRDTPILQTHEYSHGLTCGAWNRNRCSSFLIGHENGTIDVWDLLYDQFRPITSISIVLSRVQHIRSHANGKLFVSCFGNGDVHLMQISDFLSSHKVAEKVKLIEVFEREVKREVLFLTKIREQKMALSQKPEEAGEDDDAKNVNPETLMNECTTDFVKMTEEN